jgi:hypothetical protein
MTARYRHEIRNDKNRCVPTGGRGVDDESRF